MMMKMPDFKVPPLTAAEAAFLMWGALVVALVFLLKFLVDSRRERRVSARSDRT